MPFAELILTHLADKPLLLAIDGSQVGQECMPIVVGVIYQQRAIPLAWLVYKGKKGHTTADRELAALQKVLPLIPAGPKVVLVGDGEYDNTELLQWVTDHKVWAKLHRPPPTQKHLHLNYKRLNKIPPITRAMRI